MGWVERRVLSSKWGSVRNTLSSPGIAVVENRRSSWRNVVDCVVSGARCSGLVSTIILPIQGNGCPIYHQPTEKMRPLKLGGRGRFIWFRPMEGFAPMFQFQPECEVRIPTLHCSELSIILKKGTLVNQLVLQGTHKNKCRCACACACARERENRAEGKKKIINNKQASLVTSLDWGSNKDKSGEIGISLTEAMTQKPHAKIQ